MHLGKRVRKWLEELRHKGARHWWTMLALLGGLYIANPYIDEYLNFKEVEIWLFQTLSRLSIHPFKPNAVRLVLIGDDEYWLGPLSGRGPLKRDYLARLVRALDQTQAAVIALDFSFRSPDPGRITTPLDYKAETDQLMAALEQTAVHRKVVLAKSIWVNNEGAYITEPDQYQAHGICSDPARSTPTAVAPGVPNVANISCGYVSLPRDMRTVPGSITLAGGAHLDSFALAVARAIAPQSAKAAQGMNFGSYVPLQAWSDAGFVIKAGDLLRAPAAFAASVAGRAVIVGGNWSSLASGRGLPSDLHDTPVGSLVGAAVNANFAEAILGGHLYAPTAKWLPHACEIIFSVVAAVVFSREHGPLTKIVALVGITAVMVTFQWLLLHTVGIFFDAFVPVAGLWLHSLVERLIGEPE